MRKEEPKPKMNQGESKFNALVSAATNSPGEWVAEDYTPKVKSNANVYGNIYALIGRQHAEVRMQGNAVFVRVNK